MDQDRDLELQRYRLCQLAFGLLSAALLLACVSNVLSLPRHFGGRNFLPWLLNSTAWQWIDAPIVWLSLTGVYLLWGRWPYPSWQRRTGLLLVFCMADAVLWALDHGNELGLRVGDVGHLWLRYNLGQALGWAEFALIASIASDVLVHLGIEQAAETSRATRSLVATGAVVWMLLFMLRTDWRRGWPLGFRRFLSFDMLVLDLGSTMIGTIALIQITALSIAATKQTASVVVELLREDLADDQFAKPSEEAFHTLANQGVE